MKNLKKNTWSNLLLREWAIFWPKSKIYKGYVSWQKGFFHEKFEKNYMKQFVIERMGDFLTKYGHESIVFFRDLTFFWQNMGIRAVVFSFKIGKKGVPIDFFWPIIYRSFERIDFIFDQIWAWKQGVFHVIFQRKWHENTTFLIEWVFFWKIWE